MRSGSHLYHVRPCREADIETVIALWQQLPGIVLRTDDSPAAIERFLLQGQGSGWVAEVDGRVIGAVLAGQDGRRGYLYHLAVAELWQRLGIGWALVDAVLQEMTAAGITRHHVMVLADNAQAHGFWEQLGWRQRQDVLVYTHSEEDVDAAAATAPFR